MGGSHGFDNDELIGSQPSCSEGPTQAGGSLTRCQSPYTLGLGAQRAETYTSSALSPLCGVRYHHLRCLVFSIQDQPSAVRWVITELITRELAMQNDTTQQGVAKQ